MLLLVLDLDLDLDRPSKGGRGTRTRSAEGRLSASLILCLVKRFCALLMNERPYQSTDLSNVIETYTASIRSLAASYYSPEQIAAWAPVPPDATRWQERLARLHTIISESAGYSRALLPTPPRDTSIFFTLIPRSPVAVSPAAFTIVSSPHCRRSTPR